MNMSIGIVGLPSVGKSTLFNALLKRQIAQVGEYPYTTIEPNIGVVEVPDERLDKVSAISNISKKVPASIKFIDIAGLIKGAHAGEGLGNQFLAHIREADAILHIVRVFESPNVPHPYQKIDPIIDVETVNQELELASIKKPTIYVLNVSEKDLKKAMPAGRQDFSLPFSFIKICAKLEAELSDLSESEQEGYLRELGVDPSAHSTNSGQASSGLDQVIVESYKLLNLITFFTIVGGKQTQAWPIKNGANIIDAANLVHTDFAKHFIKAEVILVGDLLSVGGWKNAKEEGKIRLEGRDYIVKDGDVIEFKIG